MKVRWKLQMAADQRVVWTSALGVWLSHVPAGRFGSFWDLVAAGSRLSLLREGGG